MAVCLDPSSGTDAAQLDAYLRQLLPALSRAHGVADAGTRGLAEPPLPLSSTHALAVRCGHPIAVCTCFLQLLCICMNRRQLAAARPGPGCPAGSRPHAACSQRAVPRPGCTCRCAAVRAASLLRVNSSHLQSLQAYVPVTPSRVTPSARGRSCSRGLSPPCIPRLPQAPCRSCWRVRCSS